jgi:hypothetical protein
MGLGFELETKNGKRLPNQYRIGYIGFGWLRQSLSHHISEDFAYHYEGFLKQSFLNRNKEHVDWLNNFSENHKEYDKIIDAFFFHSDCDGEWNKQEIDFLIEWLSEHKPKKQEDENKRDWVEEYEGLLDMLKTPNLYKVIFC